MLLDPLEEGADAVAHPDLARLVVSAVSARRTKICCTCSSSSETCRSFFDGKCSNMSAFEMPAAWAISSIEAPLKPRREKSSSAESRIAARRSSALRRLRVGRVSGGAAT